MGRRISLGHLNNFAMVGAAQALTASALWGALGTTRLRPASILATTSLSWTNYFLVSCLSVLAVPNVRHYYSSFRIARLYSSFKGDAGLTPNAPVMGAGVRSTEASLPLAG